MSPDQLEDTLDVETKSEMNVEEDSDDDETSVSPTNTKTDKTRRVSHSEIERRRREKMNRYIDEIAQLLPIDAVKKLDKLTVLRVAVDTIKHLKGSSSKMSSSGFGKQMYLDDNELLELILATLAEMETFFYLIIECQKGRICYASTSVENILGCKPTDLCSQSIFDIVHPSDIDIIKQQLMNEKKTSTITTDDSPSESKCIPLFPKQSCLEIGNRRTFSCRINTRKRRTIRTTTTTTSVNDNYVTIDFVGYIKHYSLTNDEQIETKPRTDRRASTISILTPYDVVTAIGTNPTSCLIAMGNLAKHIDKSKPNHENINNIDRMFLCKLNPDGQFTYFDHICYSLLGYLSQDLLGMNLKDFIHEDDQNKVMETWNRVCRDRQIVTSGNYRFRTKDNVYIVLQTIFEPFINPWNDELEIIVARNKTKIKSTRVQSSSVTSKNENLRIIDGEMPTTFDPTELLRQFLS